MTPAQSREEPSIWLSLFEQEFGGGACPRTLYPPFSLSLFLPGLVFFLPISLARNLWKAVGRNEVD